VRASYSLICGAHHEPCLLIHSPAHLHSHIHSISHPSLTPNIFYLPLRRRARFSCSLLSLLYGGRSCHIALVSQAVTHALTMSARCKKYHRRIWYESTMYTCTYYSTTTSLLRLLIFTVIIVIITPIHTTITAIAPYYTHDYYRCNVISVYIVSYGCIKTLTSRVSSCSNRCGCSRDRGYRRTHHAGLRVHADMYLKFSSPHQYYQVSCKDMPCYAMRCYAMLCYAMPCYAMLCHAMLCYAMLCYAMLCHAMICHAILCYAMLCYAMLCYAMLCYAMLCHAMLCYAMLCYAMLCYAML